MLLQKLSYLIVPRYPALQFLPILFDANVLFYKVHSIVVEAKSPLKLQFGFWGQFFTSIGRGRYWRLL